jgi:hypothetical protein
MNWEVVIVIGCILVSAVVGLVLGFVLGCSHVDRVQVGGSILPTEWSNAKNPETWLILSIEHDGCWWKTNEIAYTPNRSKAGRYTFRRALEIVTAANENLRDEGKPNEVICPDWNPDEPGGQKEGP